jgi:hypothetical protein
MSWVVCHSIKNSMCGLYQKKSQGDPGNAHTTEQNQLAQEIAGASRSALREGRFTTFQGAALRGQDTALRTGNLCRLAFGRKLKFE